MRCVSKRESELHSTGRIKLGCQGIVQHRVESHADSVTHDAVVLGVGLCGCNRLLGLEVMNLTPILHV